MSLWIFSGSIQFNNLCTCIARYKKYAVLIHKNKDNTTKLMHFNKVNHFDSFALNRTLQMFKSVEVNLIFCMFN